MSFTLGEISKWAKSRGFKVSKKDGVFLWSSLENVNIKGQENNIEDVAKAIFNQISNNKWIEHQKQYERNKSKM